jgi:hypothetical protein
MDLHISEIQEWYEMFATKSVSTLGEGEEAVVQTKYHEVW